MKNLSIKVIVTCFTIFLFAQNNTAQSPIDFDKYYGNILISKLNKNGSLDTFKLMEWVQGNLPNVKLTDQNGEIVNHETFKNKVVLIDFWFLNCKPCIAELPGIDLLRKKNNSPNLEIITFANNSLNELNQTILSKRTFQMRIIPNIFLVSQKSYPTKILLNSKSEIIDGKNTGSVAKNSVQMVLDYYQPLINKELKKFGHSTDLKN